MPHAGEAARRFVQSSFAAGWAKSIRRRERNPEIPMPRTEISPREGEAMSRLSASMAELASRDALRRQSLSEGAVR
jgi:hypothetical protein